ncbi:hypothetical protein [Micromonospora globbae]|uniref:hypothetical protein n=1 Tax=Micromonospora globbae TaxID=1894969 RepID=UPI00341EDD11
MALLNVQTVTAAGITPAAPVQLTAWPAGDTISGSDIGDRGVWVEVSNGSAGSLDLRVSDPGFTPAGNPAANGYTSVPVPAGQSRKVYIGRHNVDPATQVAKIGASASNASFTVAAFRY